MASDIVKLILETEEDCKNKEADARKKAEAKKQKGKEEAERILADARSQVDSMVNNDAQAISGSAQLRLDKQKQKFKTECEALKKNASNNIDRVTGLVIEAIAT